MLPDIKTLAMPVSPHEFQGVVTHHFSRLKNVFFRVGRQIRDRSVVLKKDRLPLAPCTRTGIAKLTNPNCT
jgi:hypothetical protein